MDAARYQEGEPPVEDAGVLHAEAQAVVDEIEDLVRRINRTNAATELEPGQTITDAIARRDALAAKHKLAANLADAASGRGSGHGWVRQLRSELRYVTDLQDGVATVGGVTDRDVDACDGNLHWEGTDLGVCSTTLLGVTVIIIHRPVVSRAAETGAGRIGLRVRQEPGRRRAVAATPLSAIRQRSVTRSRPVTTRSPEQRGDC